MYKTDVIQRVAKEKRLSKRVVADVIGATHRLIEETLRAGDAVTLVAAYESTGTEIALWMESGRIPGGGRAGPGQVLTRSLPVGQTIASCYFDGTFTFRGPLPKDAVPPRLERMLFLLDPAEMVLAEMGGTRQLYPLVRPAP